MVPSQRCLNLCPETAWWLSLTFKFICASLVTNHPDRMPQVIILAFAQPTWHNLYIQHLRRHKPPPDGRVSSARTRQVCVLVAALCKCLPIHIGAVHSAARSIVTARRPLFKCCVHLESACLQISRSAQIIVEIESERSTDWLISWCPRERQGAAGWEESFGRQTTRVLGGVTSTYSKWTRGFFLFLLTGSL